MSLSDRCAGMPRRVRELPLAYRLSVRMFVGVCGEDNLLCGWMVLAMSRGRATSPPQP